jgi:Zn-dependent protease
MDSVEIQEIVVSVLAISFAFSLGGEGLASLGDLVFWITFGITIVTVGLGFVLHELAHRYVARRYGAYAIFRAWPWGLALMVGLAVMRSPILFAAPGAVYIYSQYITRRENGIISVAGPITNLALAIAFGAIAFGIPRGDAMMEFLREATWIGFRVNLFLGLFNMIPTFPLDGSKVWGWSKEVWVGFMLFAGGLFFLTMQFTPFIN